MLPSPTTKTRFFFMSVLERPQCTATRTRHRSSSVSSRAMTMLPAVSPQSTGSTTPVIADAASEARNATARMTSIGSTMRPSGYQRSSCVRTSGLRRRALVPERRAHRAGADDIRADVVAAEFQRERLGQADQPGLARAVGGVAERGQPIHRTDVDDRARAARLHVGQHGVGAVVGAVQIRVDVVAETCGRRALQARIRWTHRRC